MVDQEKSELLVVRLPLTEKDRRTAAVAEHGVPADIALVFAAVVRAIGIRAPDSGLEHLATITWFEDECEPCIGAWAKLAIGRNQSLRVVSESAAIAQIAARDAEIARLRGALARINAYPISEYRADLCMNMASIANSTLLGAAGEKS